MKKWQWRWWWKEGEGAIKVVPEAYVAGMVEVASEMEAMDAGRGAPEWSMR